MFLCWNDDSGVFEIVVVVAVQSTFRIEIHQNKVFLFLNFFF